MTEAGTIDQPGLFDLREYSSPDRVDRSVVLTEPTRGDPLPREGDSGAVPPTSGADAPSSAATPEDNERWEALVADLEATGRYRVLRRFDERLDDPPAPVVGSGVRKGVYLDVETTGLMAHDRIIELAMLVFHYDETGRVVHVTEAFDRLEDPGRAIPADVVSLTGITNDMVRGQRIVDEEVARLLDGVDLVVAHNAGFDRQFAEARFPFFSEVDWACSMADVDWSAGGLRSRRLENLALAKGYFYQAHRAIYDCHVALGLLRMPIRESGPPAFADLLQRSAAVWVRLWAEGSPFEKKDDLKARGYRWSGQAKAWWKDLPASQHEAEVEWLADNVYPRRRALPFLTITPRNRYSRRLPEAPPASAERL